MRKKTMRKRGGAIAICTLLATSLLSTNVFAAPADIGSLKGAQIPSSKDRITGESLYPHFISDKTAAIQLGKALFWDMQVGSDGQACASCHFNAGGDIRVKNTINQGPNGEFDIGDADAPNYTVTAADFPVSSDDRVTSQGVFPTSFNDIIAGLAAEDCNILAPDPLGFHVNGTNVRRVEPRNTPTMINAAFQYRTFWDGRANNIFNGVDPFGRRNVDARIYEASSPSDNWSSRKIELTNAHLASQAVGPPGSEFEMSCAGRFFKHLGKKLLSLDPLASQHVHPGDSVLGSIAAAGTGLTKSYADMIKSAFPNKFWDSNNYDADGFSLMERNFSLFWGLAVQAYQQTLISDDSPFDNGTLSESAQRGESVFRNEGKCINCHKTAMFTGASSLHLIDEAQENGLVERMLMGHENVPYNIVVDGVIKNRWGPLAQVSINAGGSPTKLGISGSGTVSGGIQVTWMADGDVTCYYTTDSFVLDVDGNTATRDARITGSSSEVDSCGTVTIKILENRKLFNITDSVSTKRRIKGLLNGDLAIRQPALYDNGFYNIGVRPTAEDLGVGDVDPWGNPLSFSRQYKQKLLGLDVKDPFEVDECKFEVRYNPAIDVFFFPGGFDEIACTDIDPVTGEAVASKAFRPTNNAANQDAIKNIRVAVDGAFKTPTIRNTELNGPYFRNGGQATLEQLVAFYNRGGDFSNKPNKDPDITTLGLSLEQQADLVEFIKSTTDERVRCEKAPFDHPELRIPDGHPNDHNSVTDSDGNGEADDDLLTLSAVGASGAATCISPFSP